MKPLNIIASTDGLRPAMNYIQLKDGFFNVTDANKLFKCPVNEIFQNDILENLPTECYFLANDWKNSKIEKAVFMKFTNGLIECLDKKFNTLGFLKFIDSEQFEKQVGRFPNTEAVWPNAEYKTHINEISFNPEFLEQLGRANNKLPLYLEFFGDNKSIIVHYKESEAKGLLMPILLNHIKN
jgi:hypothetical protein